MNAVYNNFDPIVPEFWITHVASKKFSGLEIYLIEEMLSVRNFCDKCKSVTTLMLHILLLSHKGK